MAVARTEQHEGEEDTLVRTIQNKNRGTHRKEGKATINNSAKKQGEGQEKPGDIRGVERNNRNEDVFARPYEIREGDLDLPERRKRYILVSGRRKSRCTDVCLWQTTVE